MNVLKNWAVFEYSWQGRPVICHEARQVNNNG